MQITKENKSNDFSDGYGVFTDKFGNIYEGEWQNHKKHGKGKMTYKDRDYILEQYEGEFQH